MISQQKTPLPGSREAGGFLLLSLAAGAFIATLFYAESFPALRIPFVYATPVLLSAALLLVYRLTLLGTAAVPPLPFILGVVFFAGGAAFDILATLLHSPDLKREGNPFARTLLDSSHPLMVVFVYGFVCQVLYVSVQCISWLAFLRHRSTILASLRGFQSRLLFIKAATGGANLTWRQWFIPLRWSELPQMYYAFWLLAMLMLVGSVDRWYLGFSWFELVPRIRWQVMTLTVIGGIACYLTWLWHASRKRAIVVADATEEKSLE